MQQCCSSQSCGSVGSAATKGFAATLRDLLWQCAELEHRVETDLIRCVELRLLLVCALSKGSSMQQCCSSREKQRK